MNFFKKLFSKKTKMNESHHTDVKDADKSEMFYTPLEKIIPVFFEGKIDKRPFFNELVNIPLIMPTVNREKTQPLVITKEASSPMVVFATAEERSRQIKEAFPDVKESTQVSLAQYMSSISEPVSIVINPGWKFEIVIEKKSVEELMQSVSMEFCNLDIMVSRYMSNQIAMDELCQAIHQYSAGIILLEDDTEKLAENMALINRADETYAALFSSEAFAQEYRELYPEFAFSANARGDELLSLIPESAGIILNPDSEYEIIINNYTLKQKKRYS